MHITLLQKIPIKGAKQDDKMGKTLSLALNVAGARDMFTKQLLVCF